jgi:hypothetical protein
MFRAKWREAFIGYLGVPPDASIQEFIEMISRDPPICISVD